MDNQGGRFNRQENRKSKIWPYFVVFLLGLIIFNLPVKNQPASLVRLSENPEVYKIEDNQKRPISSPKVFEKMYQWENVKSVEEINLTEGEAITGALWFGQAAIQPLDILRVNYLLPDDLVGQEIELKTEDARGQNQRILKKFIATDSGGLIETTVGGQLGINKIYLTSQGKLITPKAEIQIEAQNIISSGLPDLDIFYSRVRAWMAQDIAYCQGIKGYRSPDTNYIWIRDHTHQSKGFCYWEEDMTGAIDWFFANQKSDGSFDDICPGGRMEVEADVEYLMAIAVYRAWQATGDNQWMFSHLDQLEKGLKYTMSDRDRWNGNYRLVKRPFTIDTWDFQWRDGTNLIHEKTPFGFMSGDNSGLYEAARLLSEMFTVKGDLTKGGYWQRIAEEIKSRSNRYLWNEDGGYYKSFFHLDEPVPGVNINENEVLSLSNVYNLNRGDFVSQPRGKRIIEEYRRRGETVEWKGQRFFQEWFSVNPDYGGNKWGTLSADKSGEYVNGGIMPLVGGELSRAAFERGFEEYGLRELLEYIELTKKHGNKTYLWYWPDGRPGVSGPETLATDGWGSSAFLSAFIEGLVGIQDESKLFQQVKISPRWAVAETQDATAVIRYGASDGYFAYRWIANPEEKTVEISYTGSGQTADFHVLLPPKITAKSVAIDGQKSDFENKLVEESSYVDFTSAISGVKKAVISY